MTSPNHVIFLPDFDPADLRSFLPQQNSYEDSQVAPMDISSSNPDAEFLPTGDGESSETKTSGVHPELTTVPNASSAGSATVVTHTTQTGSEENNVVPGPVGPDGPTEHGLETPSPSTTSTRVRRTAHLVPRYKYDTVPQNSPPLSVEEMAEAFGDTTSSEGHDPENEPDVPRPISQEFQSSESLTNPFSFGDNEGDMKRDVDPASYVFQFDPSSAPFSLFDTSDPPSTNPDVVKPLTPPSSVAAENPTLFISVTSPTETDSKTAPPLTPSLVSPSLPTPVPSKPNDVPADQKREIAEPAPPSSVSGRFFVFYLRFVTMEDYVVNLSWSEDLRRIYIDTVFKLMNIGFYRWIKTVHVSRDRIRLFCHSDDPQCQITTFLQARFAEVVSGLTSILPHGFPCETVSGSILPVDDIKTYLTQLAESDTKQDPTGVWIKRQSTPLSNPEDKQSGVKDQENGVVRVSIPKGVAKTMPTGSALPESCVKADEWPSDSLVGTEIRTESDDDDDDEVSENETEPAEEEEGEDPESSENEDSSENPDEGGDEDGDEESGNEEKKQVINLMVRYLTGQVSDVEMATTLSRTIVAEMKELKENQDSEDENDPSEQEDETKEEASETESSTEEEDEKQEEEKEIEDVNTVDPTTSKRRFFYPKLGLVMAASAAASFYLQPMLTRFLDTWFL